MREDLKQILEIQELDMQMIQLMRLKKERQKELENIKAIKTELHHKCVIKEGEIVEIKKDTRILEGEIEEITAKIKQLESQQNQIKKVDEFNALSQEMSRAERIRVNNEQKASDLCDKLAAEEVILKSLTESFESTTESSRVLEEEIRESIQRINEEGVSLKEQRDKLVGKADPEVFQIYERLLRNKQDRVVVPIENRTCSGCHISITEQDENLVRKGERLIYC